jgi:lipopolysaccharide transport system ATP-binding protein
VRDLDFEVESGAVLGIVGSNGAGKSTLLKILSRISSPTVGRAEVRGRVASLLEVGTGFHAELTGRENVHMSAAILGMKRADVKQRFDQIIDFAEIGPFVETPLKFYSSGMYLRLAFAVAAHLEPDVLFIDEVLAVGDAAFQARCLGRMDEAAREGRTILFVSHNAAAIRSLTSTCIFLDKGVLRSQGPTSVVLDEYLTQATGSGSHVAHLAGAELEPYHRSNRADSPVRITAVWVDQARAGLGAIAVGDPVTISVEIENDISLRNATVAVAIKRRDGVVALNTLSLDAGFSLSSKPGRVVVRCALAAVSLAPGEYLVDVGLNQTTMAEAWDAVIDCPLFAVADNRGEIVHWLDRNWGAIYMTGAVWEADVVGGA